jgi:hypothetical protein
MYDIETTEEFDKWLENPGRQTRKVIVKGDLNA